MTIHGVIARVPYAPKAGIPSRKFVVRYVPKGDIRIAANCRLFDHLVGAGKQRRRNFEAERLGRLEVDNQLEFGRLFHG